MDGQLQRDFHDEIDALISTIGEELVTIKEGEAELQCTVAVTLDPSEETIIISAEDGKDYRQFETAHLPSVNLLFRLPVGYPFEKPEIDVASIWMPTPVKERLLTHLRDILQANVGCPVLFLCYEALKKFVSRMGIHEIHLDSNDFSAGNKLRPIEMLKLVREESEKAEMSAFLTQCHDCEVCFENRPGRNCVRFTPCGHSFCKECVGAFFKEKLRSQKVSPLTCLAENCESSAQQSVIIELLGQKEFDRYEKILLKKAIERMDDMVTCPRISCQKPSIRSRTTEYLATCLVCGYNFCTACNHVYHGLDTCYGTWGLREVTLDEYLLATQEGRKKMALWYGGMKNMETEMEKQFRKDDARSYEWMQGHSKGCPQCNIPIQRQSGCNMMVCSMCDTHFCWNCDAVLGRNPYKHFNTSTDCRGEGPQIPLD